MKPGDPLPWLWLSATTEDLDEQRDFLERALAADPTNAAARRGLVMLSDKLDKSRLSEEGKGFQPRRPVEPQEAIVLQAFTCAQCGGRMEFDIQQQNGVHVLWICEVIREVQVDEQLVELFDPSLIGAARFDEKQAQRRLRLWLGNGWFIPDDLKSMARTSRLRPAYYPFWIFDGTLQMKWICQVNEGTSRNGFWTARQGVETEMFDDVLVPGLRSMDARELARAEPFRLKELVAFKPEILAGWKAVTYDLPLADASLKAREKVARKLRRELYSRVLLGYEKRDLRSGSVSWGGITYRLVLLPLWVGTYRYRGKNYRLLINGQTGKVGGENRSIPSKWLVSS
jgi:hypothetical protein